MENKHFRITLYQGHSSFYQECEKASEAYDLMYDAGLLTGVQIDMDEVMEVLVDMRNGRKLSHQERNWRLEILNGEI